MLQRVKKVYLDTRQDLYQGKLYAAAGQEGVYVLGSNGLEEFKDLTIDILETIDDLLFGVAGKFVVQFNGSEWWGGDLDL